MCINMAASSSKRFRLYSVAAGGESNSWPGVNAGCQLCLYAGCVKPVLTSESERKFCCVMHRNLHMSNLAMTRSCRVQETIVASSSGAAVVEDYTVSDSNKPKCMLPGCCKKALRDDRTGQHFDFCGKKHMLTMVEIWSREGRLCQLEECCRHVYVEEEGMCFDYCGMKHATFAAARKGSTMKTETLAIESSIIDPREMLRTTSGQAQDSEAESPLENLVDSEVGYHEKISDSELLRLLKGEASEERTPRVLHGINIYDFHPWELVHKFGGYRPRYLIHSVTQQRDQRGQPQQRRKTKDGFSWKQSGPAHLSESKDMETRYLKYMLEKSDRFCHLPHVQEYMKFKQACISQQSRKRKGPKCRWKLHEISLRESGDLDMNSTKIVWMIFQDPQGEPVWPPCRQPHSFEAVPTEIAVPDVILNPSLVQDFQTHNVENDIGRNEPQLDVTVNSMQSDFGNTDIMDLGSGLAADLRWEHLVEDLDLCETQLTQMDPGSGVAEDSHPQFDADSLELFLPVTGE